MTPSDKVQDITRQISINMCGREDSMHVTLEEKVLKLSDVKGCGVQDESTLHVDHRVGEGGDPRARRPTSRAK